MTEIVCQRCEHPNSPMANFCSSCGYDLTRQSEVTDLHTIELNPEELPQTEGVPGVGQEAVFVVKRGSKAGSRFLVDTPGCHARPSSRKCDLSR